MTTTSAFIEEITRLNKRVTELRTALQAYHRAYGHLTTIDHPCICRDDADCYAPIDTACAPRS